MSFAISRLTPTLNAHVYCIARSSLSTMGPAVTVLTKPPAETCLRSPTRHDQPAGRSTATPAFGPATGVRHAVAFASPGLTGNVPVTAGDATCVVSYASVGAITSRWATVIRIGVCVYWNTLPMPPLTTVFPSPETL